MRYLGGYFGGSPNNHDPTVRQPPKGEFALILTYEVFISLVFYSSLINRLKGWIISESGERG